MESTNQGDPNGLLSYGGLPADYFFWVIRRYMAIRHIFFLYLCPIHLDKNIIFFLLLMGMGRVKQRHGTNCLPPPLNTIVFFPNMIRIKGRIIFGNSIQLAYTSIKAIPFLNDP